MNSFHARKLDLAALLLGCAALPACTSTINSRAIDPAAATPTSGLVYYLPARVFDIETSFVILDCALLPNGKAQLVYDVQPTVKAGIVADRRHAYTIDGGLSGRALKNLNFEISQYENGTLKAINAAVDDRTAETATSVVSGALKYGLALTGLGLFAGGKAATVRPSVNLLPEDQLAPVRAACGDQVTNALIAVRKLSGQIDAATEAAEAKAKLLAAATDAEKALIQARASLKAAKETAAAADVAHAEKAVDKAVADLAGAQGKVASSPSSAPPSALRQRVAAIVQRDLTFKSSLSFIPNEHEATETLSIIYPAARLQLAGLDTVQDLRAPIKLSTAYARVATADTYLPKRAKIAPNATAKGVWLRSPATARLNVCVDPCGESDVRVSQVYTIPQKGQLTMLPLKSMMFSKSNVKLALAPDGSVGSLFFDSTAPAERAATAFSSTGDSLVDFDTKLRALRTALVAEGTAADKAVIEKDIAIVELQQKLASTSDTTTTDQARQLSDLQFQIDQVERQIKLREAQKKLEALDAPGQP